MSNKLSQGRRFRRLIGIMEAVTSRKPNGRRTEYPFLDWRIPIMGIARMLEGILAEN